MNHKDFYMGVGVGYLMEKYGGDFLHALAEYLKEKQRLEEIEKARVVDVFGDEICEVVAPSTLKPKVLCWDEIK